MYKLIFSPASPYVRKIRLAAFAAGLDARIELVTEDNKDENELIRSQNPLGKIPILKKPDGDCLFDSRVITVSYTHLTLPTKA